MTVSPGLEGISVARTELSHIDGEQGHLIYRGHWVRDLALRHSFEDVVHLLWHGRLPEPEEGARFQARLASFRKLPDSVRTVIDALPPETGMMSVLRTAVSALQEEASWPPTPEQGLRVLAKVPSIIAHRHRRLRGEPVVEPRADLSHTGNYLYMLRGTAPSSAHVRALEAYWILTAEHGMNASTFASRVVISTQSDLISALTAAIGALKGPLHGGAPSEVESMLEAIGSEEHAEPWLRSRLEAGERLMGFGHRVYKTRDPRAETLRKVAEELADEVPWFRLAVRVEREAVRLLNQYKPGRRLYTNVEFYAAAVLRAVGLPKELYTPTFVASRTAGWCAHIFEQAAANRIIRPQAEYVGSMPQ